LLSRCPYFQVYISPLVCNTLIFFLRVESPC